MQISAKVIADSVPKHAHVNGGVRLTTMELTYPRFIHSEFMTHRVFSRNAASSRAIPVSKMLKQVWSDPAMPVWWGKNQAGMQAKEELTGWRLTAARKLWVLAGWVMVCFAWAFTKIGLHKQIANRILEPWMWMKTIVSATDWGNFFNLRVHPDAQPEMKVLAEVMLKAYKGSQPMQLPPDMWHLPYVTKGEWVSLAWEGPGAREDRQWVLQKLSAARCARVSYLNHDGTKPDVEKDLALWAKLVEAPHASPFEHQAMPCAGKHGNFHGWKQYRQFIPNENQPQYQGI